MGKGNLSRLSKEELLDKQKSLTRFTVGFTVGMIVIILILLYLTYTCHIYQLMIVIIGCIIILIPSFSQLYQLHKELSKRGD